MESNWNNANTMKNINFYTVRTLAKDLGLPKELASEIVQYKRKKGKICSFDELLNIKGMSPCLMDRIKDNTTIPKEKDVCVGKGHKTSVSKRQGQLPTVSKHKKRFRKATPTKQKSHLNEIKTESNFQLEDCEWAVFPVSVYPSPSENEIVIKYRKEVNGSAKVVSLPSPLVLKDNTKKSVCVQTPKAFLQNCDSTERGVPKTPKHIPMQHSAVVDTGEQTEYATSAKFSTQPVHGSNLTSSNSNIREQQFGAFLTPDNVKQHDDNYGFKHPPDKEKRASIRNWLKQISQTELMEIPKTKSVCEMKVDEIQAINQHQKADQTTKQQKQQKETDEHKPDEAISPAGVAKMKNTSLELMSEEQEHRPEVEKNRTEAGGKMEGIQQNTRTEKPNADDFVQNKVKDTKNIDKKQNNDNKQQLEANGYDLQQPGTSSMEDKVPSQTNKVIQTKERSKDEKNLQDSRENKDNKQKQREKEHRHHKHENIKKDELRTHRSHHRHHRHTKGSNAPDHKEHHHKKGHKRERHQTEDTEKLKKEETSKETMAGTCAVS